MQAKLNILMISKQTLGDEAFYKRWEVLGNVSKEMKDADIIVTDHHTEINDRLLKEHPRLKVLASPNTGLTHLTYNREKHPHIKVIHLAGDFRLNEVSSVSEWVFWMILNFARHKINVGTKLKDKTIGVIGYGRIGQQVAKRAIGFEMNVLIYQYPPMQTHKVYEKQVSLTSLLKQSDFVSVHINECKENYQFLAGPQFCVMKPTAFFLNSSRASVINTMDLLECLKHKKIAGAALDVWDSIDLVNFGSTPSNLVLTPHIAGTTLEDRQYTDELLLEMVKEHLRGTSDYLPVNSH